MNIMNQPLPPDHDRQVADCAFELFDRLDFPSRRKNPPLLTVFRLYCLQQMTVTQVARKCRCSLSTVSDRLKLIEQRTGAPPKTLRAYARLATKS